MTRLQYLAALIVLLVASDMPLALAKLQKKVAMGKLAAPVKTLNESERRARYELAEARARAANKSVGYVQLDDYMKGVVGNAVRVRHLNRLIVPLFSNLGFMPYLKNLLCSMTRVKVESYVVVSMDNVMCSHLRAKGFTESADACVQPYERRPLSEDTQGSEYSAYNSLHFWRLVIQRPLWVVWLLTQDYTVLQCDVDIVFLHNPIPALTTPNMQRFNALFQSEQTYGINCGFYLVRPGNATLTCAEMQPLEPLYVFPSHRSSLNPGRARFMQMWLDDMIGPNARHVVKGGKMHEQHSFVRINSIASHDKSLGFLSKKLNQSEFPNGKIWYQYWTWTSKKSAYILHCNWVKFNKKTRFRRDNLWFLDEDDQVRGDEPNSWSANLPSIACSLSSPAHRSVVQASTPTRSSARAIACPSLMGARWASAAATAAAQTTTSMLQPSTRGTSFDGPRMQTCGTRWRRGLRAKLPHLL